MIPFSAALKECVREREREGKAERKYRYCQNYREHEKLLQRYAIIYAEKTQFENGKLRKLN